SSESAFERLRRLNPDASIIRSLPADAPRRFGARGTAGFPWLPRRLGDRNLMLIGDAAGYAEPYSGEGIGQAMCSGAHAATAILRGGNVLATYEALMRQEHRWVFWRTRLISAILRLGVIYDLARSIPLGPERVLSQMLARIHVGPPNVQLGSLLCDRS